MTLTLILPFDSERSAASEIARPAAQVPLRPMPEKPRLALVDNGKVKAVTLLTAVAEALKTRGLIDDYFVESKLPSATLSDTALDAIANEADLVISGLGDCGGCTACSTADALRCLAMGLPAFMLATEKFAFLVEATVQEYGIGGLHRLYVDHPVWSRDEAWFMETGEALAVQIAAALGRSTEEPTGIEPTDGPPETGQSSLDSIGEALGDLRQGMDVDGYDMDIVAADDSLRISVTRREGAGELCLMPQASFARIVSSALENAGIDWPSDRIEIGYPASAA